MTRKGGSNSIDSCGIRGVAAIEFSLVLPVLLLLFFGMINITQYVAMNQRINRAAELVADLVTRHSDTIPSTAIDDYFTALELSIRPVDVKDVRVEVYDFFRPAGATQAAIRWSKASANGTPCTVPAVGNANTDGSIASLVQNGDDVVAAVVCMSFTPPSDYSGLASIFPNLRIEKQVILKPRQSQTLVCTPSTPPTNCP